MKAALVVALTAGKEKKVCDDVQAMLKPMLLLTTELQAFVATHRGLLLEAQIEDDTFDGNVERLHQTLGALETDVKLLQDTMRRVRTGVLQYHRYSVEVEADVTAHIAAKAERDRLAAETREVTP